MLFGLLNAFDDSVSLLQSLSQSDAGLLSLPTTGQVGVGETSPPACLVSLIQTFGIAIPDADIRHSVCRRLLETLTMSLHVCCDPIFDHAVEKRTARQSLLFSLFQSVIAAINTDPGVAFDSIVSGKDSSSAEAHLKQVYSLISVFTQAALDPPVLIGRSASTVPPRSPASPSLQSPRPPPSEPRKQVDWKPLLTQIATTFLSKLRDYRSTETYSSLAADGALLGLLRVFLVLSHNNNEMIVLLGRHQYDDGHKKSFIAYLYHACLFPYKDHTLPAAAASRSGEAVCQSKETRALVYHILYVLCEDNPQNMAKLVEVMGQDLIRPHRTDFSTTATEPRLVPSVALKPVSWGYDPQELIKDAGCSVGLTNQGGKRLHCILML